jgi:hypothetical protein
MFSLYILGNGENSVLLYVCSVLIGLCCNYLSASECFLTSLDDVLHPSKQSYLLLR